MAVSETQQLGIGSGRGQAGQERFVRGFMVDCVTHGLLGEGFPLSAGGGRGGNSHQWELTLALPLRPCRMCRGRAMSKAERRITRWKAGFHPPTNTNLIPVPSSGCPPLRNTLDELSPPTATPLPPVQPSEGRSALPWVITRWVLMGA